MAAVTAKSAVLNIKAGVLPAGLDSTNQYVTGLGSDTDFIHIGGPDEVRAQDEKDECSGNGVTHFRIINGFFRNYYAVTPVSTREFPVIQTQHLIHAFRQLNIMCNHNKTDVEILV